MRAFLDRFVGNLSPSALLVSILFWSWCDLVPFSPLLPHTAAHNPQSWVPIVSLLFGALGLAVYAFSGRLRSQSLNPRFYAVASLLLGSLGSLAIYTGYLLTSAPLLVAGAVLTGLYQAAGAAVSGCIAVCQGKTNALIHIAACLPFNVVFVLLGMFLQPGAAIVLCAALPLLSSLSFKVFLVRGTNATTLASVEKPPRHRPHTTSRALPGYAGHIALLLLITMAFGFMEAQNPTAPDIPSVMFLDYASLFIRGACALAVFCAYVFYSRQPHAFLAIAIALMAGGLLFLGVAAPLGPWATIVANLLVITGYAVFDLLIWAILVIVHHGSSLSLCRFLCTAYAIDSLGIFMGMTLALVVPQAPWSGLAASLLGGAMLVAAFAVLGRPHSVRDSLNDALLVEDPLRVNSPNPTDPEAPFASKPLSGPKAITPDPMRLSASHTLASRYFLTDREEGVLELLLAGRSSPYIAEQLCVSPNTVKTHVRHIYAKLDIHTRQELLDLAQLS